MLIMKSSSKKNPGGRAPGGVARLPPGGLVGRVRGGLPFHSWQVPGQGFPGAAPMMSTMKAAVLRQDVGLWIFRISYTIFLLFSFFGHIAGLGGYLKLIENGSLGLLLFGLIICLPMYTARYFFPIPNSLQLRLIHYHAKKK